MRNSYYYKFIYQVFVFVLFLSVFVTDNYVIGSKEGLSSSIHHVLISVAMEPEAMPLVEHLGLTKTDELFPSHLPFVAYTGTYQDPEHRITVITNGKDSVYNTGVDNVGTVPAALATYLAIQKLQTSRQPVDLVLNAGTAGGFERVGGVIGDVYLTTGVTHHDRRIPIPGFDTYGVGKLDSTTAPSIMVDPTSIAETLQYKTGIVSTGNSLDKTATCEQTMFESNASIKDMEAAAIAWICAMVVTPFLGIKVVTDIVDGTVPTQDEFMKNLVTASQSLQEAMPRVLQVVLGKERSALVSQLDDSTKLHVKEQQT